MRISGIKANLRKTLSVALAVLVLTGVIGTIDSQTHVAAAGDTQAKQFSADFTELADIAAKSGAFSSSASEYTSKADDDAINAWINERFVLRYGREGGTSMEKAFLGQSSEDINSGDGWGGNSYWTITKDGWLKRKATNTGDQMLRKWDSLVVKGSDGKPAVLKNFETSFTVNQNSSERISGNKAGRGAVTLFFRQNAVDAKVNSSEQAAVVIGKGGDDWNTETKTIGVSVLSGSEITDTANDIYKNTKTPIANLDSVEQFRVKVRVVGTDCTVTITSLDGATEYYSGTKTLSVENSGYISYGITNSTRSIGDITLTNLDEQGNPVDFEMASSLYYSITNMVPYSGSYNLSWGTTPWFPFYNEWENQANVFRYSVANVFDTYNSYGVTDDRGAVYYKVPGVAISVNNDCFGAALTNKWLGCYRTPSYSSDTRTLGRITSLVYKGTGAGVRYKNFSTEFSFLFNGSNGGLVLGLRQEDAGKFFDDNGSLNKNQGIVAITRSGITVASGNEINDNIIDGIQYVFESELPQEVKISVKLVESALNIRIASSYDGTVLHNGNYTVNYNRAGYLAFGVSASEHYFADISLTHLNSDGSTIGLNLSDLVTGDMQSLYEENKLLPIGHADVVNNALQMDWTNSGFEISGNMLGALKLKTVRTDNDSFVNVIIDGAEPVKISVPVGTNTITVADNLAEGVHTVRVLSGTSPAFGTLTVKDIIYSGELNRSEIDNSKIRMMAIGDSITAGFGINGSNGDPLDFANKIATSDGYYSYAAIAARTLGAEIDTVAKEAAPISEVHGLVNKLNMRAGSPEWNWGKNQKDIIVINLGTNDEWIPGKTAQTALEDAKALLDDMRAKNPDAYIIWVYGMMRKDYEASYKAAVEYMNAKGDARVFSLEMQPNNDALEGHPSATAHVEYANQLVTFIRQNCSEIINISTQTKTIKELNNQGVIAFNGRSKWAGDAVSSVYGSAGFTVSGYIYGDFILNCFHTTENIVRLDIILDGDSDNMQTIELPAGFSGDVTLIGNLTRGEHTVQVRRASSDWGTTTYNSITYTGKLEKPETKSLRMEFIGDSLTVGEGAYGSFDDSDVKNYVRYQNSMTGYAAQTARLLEADFSMLAHCGVTTQGMIEDYNNANSDYVNDAGKKDIVVINLGTNDVGWQSESVVTEEYLSNLKTSVSNLINAVINKNGKDVCIVWCYGMMSDNYLANLREMVNETAPEGSNVFFCDLSAAKDTGGYRGHPLLAGHTASATILSEFIKNNCMRIVANGDVNLDTVTDIRDLVRYKKYFSGIEVPFAKQKADVNLDKVLDSADIVKLRKLLLGIE